MKQRELKFRWWLSHKGNGRMMGPEDIFQLTDASDESVWGSRYNPDTVTFMQFTGLQDKNGKDIYEGDVVRWDFMKERIDVFVFAVNSFHPSGWEHSSSFKYEVIGNIYENPELLK